LVCCDNQYRFVQVVLVLALLSQIDGQLELARQFRWRGDRVAALGLVSVGSGEAEVDVLAWSVSRPPGQRQGEALRLRRLGLDGRDRSQLPFERCHRQSPL